MVPKRQTDTNKHTGWKHYQLAIAGHIVVGGDNYTCDDNLVHEPVGLVGTILGE